MAVRHRPIDIVSSIGDQAMKRRMRQSPLATSPLHQRSTCSVAAAVKRADLIASRRSIMISVRSVNSRDPFGEMYTACLNECHGTARFGCVLKVYHIDCVLSYIALHYSSLYENKAAHVIGT